jgi:glycosyltransferase involved in cell wall biosynthesis
MNILHLINDLRVGGTEKSLVNYCINDKKNKNIILSFGPSDNFKNLLEKNNIKIIKLNIFSNPIKTIFQFKKIVKKNNIKVVHSWMYHSHLISILFYFLRYKIFWSIRNQNITKNNLGLKTFLLVKLLSIFSKIFVKKIFYNSILARTSHTNMGFSEKKSDVVFNGHLIEEQEINKSDEVVKLLNIYKQNNFFILGSIGRYHRVKNQLMLLDSLKLLKENNKNKFLTVFVGKGFNESSEFLRKIKDYNLKENVILIDFCEDIKKIYQSIDVNILTSLNESFPNVIAESMMYGSPCISTDVGEVRKIINNYGWVISNDINELIKTIEEAQVMKFKNYKEWNLLKDNCKRHIKINFSMDKMFDNYEKGYIS